MRSSKESTRDIREVQARSFGNRQYDSILQGTEITVHKVIGLEHRFYQLQAQIMQLQRILEHNCSPDGTTLLTTPQHGTQNHTNLVTPVQLDSIAFQLEREDSTILSEQRTVISKESKISVMWWMYNVECVCACII